MEFRRAALDTDGLVVDIGLASQALGRLLGELNYRNLDEVPAYTGRNTTTEFLARDIFERMRTAIEAGELGPQAQGLTALCVTLNESHIAWASYEADLC